MQLRNVDGVSTRLRRGLIAAVMCTVIHGCSAAGDRAPDRGPTDLGNAGSSGTSPMPLCPPTNPFCTGSADNPAGMAPISTETVKPADNRCSSQPIDLKPVGINIMVAVDGSASMATHWTRIQDAIKALRKAHPDSSFGLQIFWGEVEDTLQGAVSKNNWCGATQNRVLDVGDHSEKELLDFLGSAPPGPAFLNGLFETSPVVEPLNYYLEHMTKLADPARTNYLVFVTDGNDNCFGSVFTNKADKLLAFQKLAVELGKQNIRTVPIGFDAASRPGGTGMWGTTPANTDLDVLAAILKYGGSGLKEVPKVDDPTKLADVITKVGQSVRNCRFSIPGALDPTTAVNPFELSFSINGKLIPRDRHRAEGWNFVDGNTTQVELFGQACQAVQAALPVEAHKTCEQNVCGTAAVKVETKPRAVLLLLDASASRIECVDGSLNCLQPPGPGVQRPLSFWEDVEHAIGQSLAAPINDDVDFGLQFFPGKDAQFLSCDVATKPEIPPADGTEITIMSQMLEKLPFGLSPVVQVLENVAAAPGRLADPSVLGTVVMLTDGDDNCSGEQQNGIVTRLGAAAKSLLKAGVKTYVVRYGSDNGRTPAQDEQLRAIVANGGTASSDPTDQSKIPYVDAKSDAELNAALASIADRLASCSFTVSGLPSSADKTKANLYLNGEVIPFDAKGSKQNGWAWTDAQQTVAELYGDSCAAFKTNRRTSVVVEFGCTQVMVELL
jgi:hypothetical protein